MASPRRKRQTIRVSAQHLTAWDMLRDALDNVPRARPADSITSRELAASMGVSEPRARQILYANADLRKVEYRTSGGMRAVCYVRA